jgi:hypothetical protein
VIGPPLEAECLVEPARVDVLLVDVDREAATAERLRVCNEAAPTAFPSMHRLQEERFNRVTGEAEKPNGHVCLVRQGPEFEPVAGEDLGVRGR